MLKNKTKTTAQKLAFGNKNFYYFLLVLLFLFSNKVSSATIYFNNIYKATGTSYGFNTQSLTNINLISGTGFKFTSADPTATIFNAGNDEDGILSYTNSSGVLISIYGSISRQSKTGNTSLAVNFIPTDSTYTTPTGEAYLLVIPSKEGSFSNGTNASTSSDPIDPVLNALLNSQASSPIISISNVSVLENSGYAVFTVSLSNAANANITFTPSLTNVTAISGIDYTNSMQYYNGTTWVNITSTVSIAQNSTSLQIRVPIINYNTSATNKTFNLNTGAITGGNVINNYGTYGIGTILVPVISKSGSLTAFTSCSGSVSAEQSFSVSGVNLVSDITVTAPTGYEVSLTSGSSFAGFVTLTPSSNTVNSTAIYVRLKNNASNSASGNIVCSATNATSVNVSTGSATVNTLPAAPVGTNGSSANAGTVSISGSANSGETIDWYANSTGGSPLSGGTGTTTFTTPSISSTTTYFAQARNTASGCISTNRTAVTATINGSFSAGTIGTDQTICNGETPSSFSSLLDASGGTGTRTYQWQVSTSSSTSGFNDISGATSATYNPSSLSTTTYYKRGVSTISDGTIYSNVITITVNPLPSSPTGTDGSRSGTGTVSISGSVNAGETIDWYANSTGGSPLSGGTGTTSFTTPSISTTTIYYAEARNTSIGCLSSNRTAVTATIQTNNGDITPPAISHPISPDLSGDATIRISENISTVTTYSASEPVTWSITGGVDQNEFNINSMTGLLSFISPPSYSHPTDSTLPSNTYIVEITATDGSGNTSRQMLTVCISPICGSWGN